MFSDVDRSVSERIKSNIREKMCKRPAPMSKIIVFKNYSRILTLREKSRSMESEEAQQSNET